MSIFLSTSTNKKYKIVMYLCKITDGFNYYIQLAVRRGQNNEKMLFFSLLHTKNSIK
jgi:hypothetical protein